MSNSFHFQIILMVSLLLLFQTCTPQPLLHKIQATRQIISLYEQKLELLMQLARQQNLTIEQDQNNNNEEVNSTKQLNGLFPFRLKEQHAFQVDLPVKLQTDAKFVEPGFFISNNQIIDIKSMKVKGQLQGDIVSLQPYQVTTRINGSFVRTYKLSQIMSKSDLKLKIQNKLGKWHHATAFPDIFIQVNEKTATLTSPGQTRTHNFKSDIVQIFSIHQYKILYLSRYSLGYFNPKSLQISGQIDFQSIIQTGYYHRQQGLCFVLFKNRTISLIAHEKVLASALVTIGIEGAQIKYYHGLLFVKAGNFGCFQIFQVNIIQGKISHQKQICLPDIAQHCKERNCLPSQFNYQFYKQNSTFRVILSSPTLQKSRLFQINLQQKQHTSEKSFPWKIVVIVIGIIIVVYYRSNNWKKEPKIQVEGNSRQRRSVKKVKKQRDVQEQENEDEQDYVRQVNASLKKMNAKKLDPRKFD